MSMITIGEKLKQAREKRALTIEQVQKQTLIHAPVLAALEEGRCDEILTPTYVKGFLKKYATYLGLDYKEMFAEYAALHSDNKASGSVNTQSAPKPVKGDAKDSINILRRIIMAAAVLAILALFLLLAFTGGKLLYSLAKKSNKPAKTAVKAKKSVSLPIAVVSKKNTVKNNHSSKNIVSKNEPLNITIKVRSPVWIELKKDGEKQFQRVLPKGMVESITAREKVELFVANGDVIEIFLNGKSLGSPGRGVIKNLEITRSGMKIK